MKKEIVLFKRPKLTEPYLIAAWPGMGEVAIKAAKFLKDKLKAQEFGYIDSKGFFFPVGAWIEARLVMVPKLPRSGFYFWKNPKGTKDLIFFLSEAQPALEKGYNFAARILDLAKEFKVKQIFTFAAMPVPMDHTQSPQVWATATTKELLEDLKNYDVKFMNSGQISGLNGLFLAVAKEKGFKGVCLLGEIPIYTIQIENPKASLAILEVMSEILDIELDLTELARHAKFIEEEIEKLVGYLKSGTTSFDTITEEEIEKLKKGLSSVTKLPKSAQTKIEKLFEDAKKDISKANELKQELDKWNVYKEYEDRFLDLFKKPDKKDN